MIRTACGWGLSCLEEWGWTGILCAKIVLVWVLLGFVALEGSEVKTRILSTAGFRGTRQRNTEKDPPFQRPNPKGWVTLTEKDQVKIVSAS